MLCSYVIDHYYTMVYENFLNKYLLSIRIAPAKIQKDFDNKSFFSKFLRKNINMAFIPR